MKYAVIRTGGKQYKVAEGDIIDVERLEHENDAVAISDVLLFAEDGSVKLGSPLLSDVTIKASVVGDIRGEKIRVAKYKAKVRYRRVTGHRQALTRVKIDSIDLAGTKKTTAKETNEEKPQPKADRPMAEAAPRARRTVKKSA